MSTEDLNFTYDEAVSFFTDAYSLILQDPIKFFIKSKYFVQLIPEPAQLVALKLIFNQKLDPDKIYSVRLESKKHKKNFALTHKYMNETQIYEYMTGRTYNHATETTYNDISLIIGRRGGKTLIAAVVAIFKMVERNWQPLARKTRDPSVAILSHSTNFSAEVISIIKEICESSPILKHFIETKKERHTVSQFYMLVPFIENKKLIYSRVRTIVGTASKKSVRGMAIFCLICDEIAHWNLLENSAESDIQVLRAAAPSLAQFDEVGLILKLSSPNIKRGVLHDSYDLWTKKNSPEGVLILKAPSWFWNEIIKEKFYRIENIKDPHGFDCEYRANFVDSISNFFDATYVDKCVMAGVTFLTPDPKCGYVACIDQAFLGDAFAFTLLGWDGLRIKQYDARRWTGSRSKPIKSKEVAKYLRNICKEYGVGKIFADQFSFQPLKEIFEDFDITLECTNFGNEYKKKIYSNLRELIHGQLIDLLDNTQQTKEIKEFQAEKTGSGTVRMSHPPGGNDDMADSLSNCAFQLGLKKDLKFLIYKSTYWGLGVLKIPIPLETL